MKLHRDDVKTHIIHQLRTHCCNLYRRFKSKSNITLEYNLKFKQITVHFQNIIITFAINHIIYIHVIHIVYPNQHGE